MKYDPNPSDAPANSTQFGLEVPFTLNPASYEPERNLLFRNNGNHTFTEVARELGVANPEGRSLSAIWHDFDGDGWLDLYVANDISENKLYLNRHGNFVDAGGTAWVEEYRGSMGLAVGDFDRDGDDDLFISHWIAQGYALYQSLLSEQKNAELHFTDVAAITGIGQPSLQKNKLGREFCRFRLRWLARPRRRKWKHVRTERNVSACARVDAIVLVLERPSRLLPRLGAMEPFAFQAARQPGAGRR